MKKHTLNVSNLSHPSTIEKILDAMDNAVRRSLGWDSTGISAVENKDRRPILFVTYNKNGFRHYTASKRECCQAGGIEITDLINQVLFEAQRKLS